MHRGGCSRFLAMSKLFAAQQISYYIQFIETDLLVEKLRKAILEISMVAIYIVAIVNDNVIVFVDSGDKVRSSLPLEAWCWWKAAVVILEI